MQSRLWFIGTIVLLIMANGINGACVGGVQGCDTCTDHTDCSSCQDGYFLDGTRCRKCPVNAATCKPFDADPTKGEIQTCEGDYELDQANNKCYLCEPGCDGCSSPSSCDACLANFVEEIDQNGDRKCLPEDGCDMEGCVECSSTNEKLCNTCATGYSKFAGNCIPCIFPCDTCAYQLDIVYSTIIVPYLEALRLANAGAGTRRMLVQQQDLIDIMTIDLNSVDTETKEYIIKGFLIFQANLVLTNETIDDLVSVGAAQAAINYQIQNDLVTMDEFLESSLQYILVAVATAPTQPAFEVTEDRLEALMYSVFLQQTTCSGCTDGFFGAVVQNIYLCAPCLIPGCSDCTAAQCNGCRDTFTVAANNLACLRCQYPCLECQAGTPTNCTSCHPPYKFSQSTNTCVACDEQCATCDPSDPSICITCKAPYSQLPDGNGNCFMCDQRACKKCKGKGQEDSKVCLSCAKGRLNDDFQCELCGDNCVECEDSPDQCTKCQDGYFINDDEQCEKCMLGCKKCTEKDICDVAFDGAFVNEQTGRVQRCSRHCRTCENKGQCTSYKAGLVKILNKIFKCRKGCQDCSPTDIDTCLDCKYRYWKDGETCKACIKGCKICSDGSTCDKCGAGYAKVGSICEKCTDPNSRECDSANLDVSTKCKKGFSLNEDDDVCQFMSNVRGCAEGDPTNPNKCKSCKNNLALISDEKCVKCPFYCSGKCDPKNIMNCLSCATGFQLDGPYCVMCDVGCAECQDGKCLACQDGYEEAETEDGWMECKLECPENCGECDGLRCETCADGYIEEDDECVPDVSCNPSCTACVGGTYKDDDDNCVLCSEEHCSSCPDDICVAAFAGYYVEGGSVLACSDNCDKCLNDEFCLIPSKGFYLELASQEEDGEKEYSGVCLACSPTCQSCSGGATNCIECDESKYTMVDGVCKGRFTAKMMFTLNQNYTTFIQAGSIQEVIEAVGDLVDDLVENPDDEILDRIMILSLAEGSTEVELEVSAGSDEEANAAAGAISTGVEEDGIAGYEVLESTVSVYYDGDEYVDEDDDDGDGEEEGDQIDVALIAGLCAGGGVLIIIITAFACYKCKSKSSGQVNDETRNVIQIEQFDQKNYGYDATEIKVYQ